MKPTLSQVLALKRRSLDQKLRRASARQINAEASHDVARNEEANAVRERDAHRASQLRCRRMEAAESPFGDEGANLFFAEKVQLAVEREKASQSELDVATREAFEARLSRHKNEIKAKALAKKFGG